ncbi:hypothetical protein CCS01_19010 [Rhodopila globiformis]|uniref:Uncharacterized protein n=1 Tax=Rhodopila globiformis TaxID=1071 RepID=A0A2S6N7G0_RHOGL|nr:hypothetical protein CCS01_19010 [Rhodopila globiformis]
MAPTIAEPGCVRAAPHPLAFVVAIGFGRLRAAGDQGPLGGCGAAMPIPRAPSAVRRRGALPMPAIRPAPAAWRDPGRVRRR